MSKSKFECMSPKEYSDFLHSYTIFDKDTQQIIKDLELTEEEATHVPAALESLILEDIKRQNTKFASTNSAYFLTEFIEERTETLPPLPYEIQKLLEDDD